MKVSIVIPSRNRLVKLQKCVASVLRALEFAKSKFVKLGTLEILIVDDRSSENLKALEDQFPYVTVVKNTGTGPGSARNMGLRVSNGELILFTDSDCLVDKNWIYEYLCAFEFNAETLVFQGNPTKYQKLNLLGVLEEKLYEAMFERYVSKGSASQIDTRNCAIRRQILNVFSHPFIEAMSKAQAEARVMGNTLKHNDIDICYCSKAYVFHEDPENLLVSMKHKFRHGSGRIYVWEKCPKFKKLGSRYFWMPIFKAKVPIWYVLPVHLAFLSGYFIGLAKKK